MLFTRVRFTWVLVKKFASVKIRTLYVIRCKSVSLTRKQAKRASVRSQSDQTGYVVELKAPCKRTQHCWPTTPNIVGCYMLRPFAHLVACCWELFHPLAHHCQHGRNNSQHCWPNNVGTCCVRVQNKAARLLSLPLLSKSKIATTREKIRRNNYIAVSNRSLPASHSIIVIDNAAENMYACSLFFRTNLFFKEQKEYSHVAFVSVLIVFLLLGAWTWVPAQQVSPFALR